MPTGQITIYSKYGEPLTDIRAGVVRSWVLNGVGQAEFGIAYTDPKCRRAYFEFGNYVTIEHTNLPIWAGVIDTPRQWRGNYLTVRAYEMGYMLKYRRTTAGLKLTGKAGEIASDLVRLANEQGDTQLRVGEIYGGGSDREETLGDTAYSHMDAVRRRSGNEWTIIPDLDGKQLVGNFNWHYKAGRTVTEIELTEKNTEKTSYTLSEEGEILNDIRGYGDAITSATRLVAYSQDYESMGRYGRRQGTKTYSGNRQQATLDANTAADVALRKNPEMVFQATALDVGSTFNALRLGNRIGVNVSGVGFTDDGLGYRSTVRIVGMRYSDFTDSVELITSEDIVDGG